MAPWAASPISVRATLGRLSALSISHTKSVFYGGFVWARRSLNSQNRRFSARAVPMFERRVVSLSDPLWGGPRRALSDSLYSQTLALKLGEDGVPYSMVYVGLDDGPGRSGAVKRPKRFA